MTEKVNPPKRGVGTAVREGLLAKKDNATILAEVQAEFPQSSTSAATINWYRNDARKKGDAVPTAREAAALHADKGEPQG